MPASALVVLARASLPTRVGPGVFVLLFVSAAACGSRTGLTTPLADDGAAAQLPVAPIPLHPPDAAAPDAATAPPSPDAAALDGAPDRLAVNEASVPDAAAPCPGDVIYLASAQVNSRVGSPGRYVLQTFSPATSTIATIGAIDCPVPPGVDGEPTSLTVDRSGGIYLFVNETILFRLRANPLVCTSTGFAIENSFAGVVGTAFATDPRAPGAARAETLYMLAAKGDQTGPIVLASIDTQTFAVAVLGRLMFGTTKLTGTGAGDLFAHTAGSIWRLDPSNGAPTARWSLPSSVGAIQPFAFWGGSFYQFNAGVSGKAVIRFRPGEASTAQVGESSDDVLAAGVSTCAPLQ